MSKKYQVTQEQVPSEDEEYNIKIISESINHRQNIRKINSITTQQKNTTAALGRFTFRFLSKEYKEGFDKRVESIAQ